MTTLAHRFEWVLDQEGRGVSGAAVSVLDNATLALVPIWGDADGLVVLANPFLTDAMGRYDYFVPAGIYHERINRPGYFQADIADVVVAEASDVPGPTGPAGPTGPQGPAGPAGTSDLTLRADLAASTGATLVKDVAPFEGAVAATQHAINNRGWVSTFSGLTETQIADVKARTHATDPAVMRQRLQWVIDGIPKGGTLFIENGDYVILGTLTFKHLVHIEGESWGARILVDPAQTGMSIVLQPENNGSTSIITDKNQGWYVHNLVLEPKNGEDGSEPGDIGLYVGLSPDTSASLALLTLDHIKIATFGGYALHLNQAAMVQIIGNSSIAGISFATGADTILIADSLIRNINPVISAIYADCYYGANKFTIVDSVITAGWFGGRTSKEMIRLIRCGTFSCLRTQFETEGETPLNVDYAIRLDGQIETGPPAFGAIVGPIFRGCNFNVNGCRAVFYLDNVACAKIKENQFSHSPGYPPKPFETTANCWGLEFDDNTNVQPGDGSAAFEFMNTQDSLWDRPVVIQASAAGSVLTVTAIHNGTLGAFVATPGSLSQWLNGLGVPSDTYIIAQTSGAQGDVGVYTLSKSIGTLTSRPMMVQNGVYALDNGNATIGPWKYPTLNATYLAADAFRYDQIGYRLVDEDRVEFCGGAVVTPDNLDPGTGNPDSTSIVFHDVLPLHIRPNYDVVTVALAMTAANIYRPCGVRIDADGGVYLVDQPLGITKVCLDGVSYRRGRA